MLVHAIDQTTEQVFPGPFHDTTHLREGSIFPVHLILALIVDVRCPGHYELRPWDLGVWG